MPLDAVKIGERKAGLNDVVSLKRELDSLRGYRDVMHETLKGLVAKTQSQLTREDTAELVHALQQVADELVRHSAPAGASSKGGAPTEAGISSDELDAARADAARQQQRADAAEADLALEVGGNGGRNAKTRGRPLAGHRAAARGAGKQVHARPTRAPAGGQERDLARDRGDRARGRYGPAGLPRRAQAAHAGDARGGGGTAARGSAARRGGRGGRREGPRFRCRRRSSSSEGGEDAGGQAARAAGRGGEARAGRGCACCGAARAARRAARARRPCDGAR